MLQQKQQFSSSVAFVFVFLAVSLISENYNDT